MKLAVVVPRQYFWWATLAVLCNRRLGRFDHVKVSDSSPTGGVDKAMIGSMLLEDKRRGLNLRRGLDEVILWDGERSRTDLAIQRPDLDCGGLDYQTVGECDGGSTQLFFDQDPHQYEGYGALLSRSLRGRLSVDGSALALRGRPWLVTGKVLAQWPTLADPRLRRGQVVFAGQSGRITLETLACDDPGWLTVAGTIWRFEQGKRMDMAVKEMVRALWPHLLTLGPQQQRLALRALGRTLALSSVREAGLPHLYAFYPGRPLNAYQGYLFRESVLLDCGGVNGDELVYPRMADTIATRKAWVRTSTLSRVFEAVERADEVGTLDALGIWLSESVTEVERRLAGLQRPAVGR